MTTYPNNDEPSPVVLTPPKEANNSITFLEWLTLSKLGAILTALVFIIVGIKGQA